MVDVPVRVGVVGLGAIAERAHLPHFARARGCRLVAVSSARRSARAKARATYGVEQLHSDWRDLVTSDEVDAVAICTPNDSHAAIAAAALRHRKHVLVEKPITTTLRDAARLLALAGDAGRVLAVHHHLRFEPSVECARRILVRGTIGKVLGFEAVMTHRGPKAWAAAAHWFYDPVRVGGGALMDLGVHSFDLIRHLLADEAEHVMATTQLGPGAGRRAEHQAHCVLQMRRGAVGTVSVSWRDARYRNALYLLGERGALGIDVAAGTTWLHLKGDKKAVPLPPKSTQRTAQQDFIDQIQNLGRARGVQNASGVDGLAALTFALAAARSGQSGRRVRLSPAGR